MEFFQFLFYVLYIKILCSNKIKIYKEKKTEKQKRNKENIKEEIMSYNDDPNRKKKRQKAKFQPPKFEPTIPQKTPLIEDVVSCGKKFIDKITTSIQGTTVFSAMGVKPNKSFVLEGRPGTGKTFSLWGINNDYNRDIRRKLDGQGICNQDNKDSDDSITVRMKEFGLFLFEYNVGQHGTAYINRGAKIIHSFFANGFLHAKIAPTILMFDEADAILMSRKDSKNHHGEDDKNLETVMKNLQWAKDIEDLYVVFLTNYPEALDDAMLRSGRIDEVIHFEAPDFSARRDLFQSSIDMLNKKAGYKVVKKYDLDELAKKSKGLVNSDIDEAVKRAVRKRAAQIVGERDKRIIPAGYVTQKRIVEQIKEIKEEESLDKYIL